MAFMELLNNQPSSGPLLNDQEEEEGGLLAPLTNPVTRQEQEREVGRFAASRSSFGDPEHLARRKQLATRLQMQESAVEGAEVEAERAAEVKAFRELLLGGELPATASALSDPASAAALGDLDSIEELSWIERRWRGIQGNADALYTSATVAPDIVAQGVGGTMAFMATATPVDFLPPALNLRFGGEQVGALDAAFALLNRGVDSLVGDAFGEARQAVREEGLEISADAQENISRARESLEPGTERFLFDVGSGIQQVVGGVGASLLTRSPTGGVAFITGSVVATEYASALNSGATEQEARTRALWYGAAEGIVSYIPLGFIMKPGKKFLEPLLERILPGDTAARLFGSAAVRTVVESTPAALRTTARATDRVLGGAAFEGAQEGITEFLQMGYDIGVLNEEMTWGEAVERVSYSSLVGSAAGGPVTAASDAVHSYVGNKIVEREIQRENYRRILELRESLIPHYDKDPEAVRRFVSEAVESRFDGHVYINAEALLGQLQESSPGKEQLLRTLGLTEESMRDLALSGEDIRITGDQFADMVMADPVTTESILPHVMFGEYAQSVAELDAIVKQEQQVEEGVESPAATAEEIDAAATEVAAEAAQAEEGSRDPMEQATEETQASTVEQATEETQTADVDDVLGDVSREQIEEESGIPADIATAFAEVGKTQRNAPESAMVEAQRVMGGGVMSSVIEQIGDLTHRATERAMFGDSGYQNFAPKVRMVFNALTQKYGFLKEFNENIADNAKYDGVTETQRREEIKEVLSKYADAHATVPVYNRLQWLSREAAIAIGEQKFARARDLMTELHDLVQDQAAYEEASFDFQTDENGKIKAYDPDVAQIPGADPQVEGPVALSEQLLGLQAFFSSARQAGMTSREYQRYLSLLARRGREARTKRERDLLKQEKERLSKQWTDERAKLRETEAVESVDGMPMYKAMDSLGAERMNRQEIVDLKGEEYLKKLPLRGRKTVYTPKKAKKGESVGVSIEILAANAGYALPENAPAGASISEMFLDDLAQNWVDRDTALDRVSEALMAERHLDIRKREFAIANAIEHLQSDTTLEVLATEFLALAKATSPKAGGESAKQVTKRIKAMAQERLGDLRVREVQSRRLNTVAKRHGERARRLLRDGDRTSATKAKFQQLVAEAMAQEANSTRVETAKAVKNMRKFNQPRRKFPKMEAGFVPQIRKILAPFNLAASEVSPERASKVMLDLQKWADSNGTILRIPDFIKQMKSKNWKDMTVSEFRALNSIVLGVEQQAIRVKQYRVAGELKQVEDVAAELVETTEGLSFNTARTRELKLLTQESIHGFDKTLSKLASMDAAFRKVELLLLQLDNNVLGGPWVNAIFEPYARAAAQQADEVRRIMGPLMRDLEKLPGNPIRQKKQIYVAQLGRSYLKSELLALALNIGNESNLNKVVKGQNEGDRTQKIAWNEAGVVEAVEQNLTPAELQWVQKVWDSFESIRPFVEAVYEDVHGVAAPAMVPLNRTLNGVELKGGYFPMVYDHARAVQTEVDASNDALEGLQRVPVQEAIFSSFTKGRTAYSAPVSTQLTNVPHAIQQHLYFVTHYEASRDVRRLLNRPDIQRTMRDNLGGEYFDAIRNWVTALDTAGYSDNAGRGQSWAFGVTEQFRKNTSVAVMGFSYTTLISQLLGLSTSVAVLGQKEGGGFSVVKGGKILARGLYGYTRILGGAVISGKNPIHELHRQFDAIYQASGEMRHRLENTQREVEEVLNDLRIGSSIATRGYRRSQKFAMGMIGFVQLHMVDMPTWIGAHDQSLIDGKTNEQAVQIADSAVRLSQSSGALKDLPAIQRQKGVMRWFTLFSTYLYLLYGLQAQNIQNAKKGYNISVGKGLANTGQALSRFVFLAMLPALSDMIIRAEFDNDEFEDDPLMYSALKTLSYSLGAVPLIGRFGEQSIMSIMTGRSADYNVAVAAVPESAVKATETLIGLLDDDELSWAELETLVRGAGFVVGMPGTVQSARGFDAMEGDRHWYHFLIGDPTDNK